MSSQRRPPDSCPGNGSGDFRAAVARLERAVEDLVQVAGEQCSDRAAGFIDETTRRLRRELEQRRRESVGPRGADAGPGATVPANGYQRRRGREGPRWRSRRLYRDPARQKIAGVCAGIARYYDVEPWVVRCLAVTGLLFYPIIVFSAYWILFLVMDKPPKQGAAGGVEDDGAGAPLDPAPELHRGQAPRYRLRDVGASLNEAELRLRRMERHVTSGRYELQRELHRLDDAAGSQR
ncbi:MAG: PspC domain-containing protein [Pseudomonadota bacterium]